MNLQKAFSARFVVRCGKQTTAWNEWLSNQLKLVPKTGVLKLLDSWRGIMLIESQPKILSGIMANRIQEQILEPEGLKEQNGFMLHRGCCNSS
jgi:hypothetical protein